MNNYTTSSTENSDNSNYNNHNIRTLRISAFWYVSLVFTAALVLITSIPAINVIFGYEAAQVIITPGTTLGTVRITIDGLSAFFILVTNFTSLTGLLYSNGYLSSYRETKSAAAFALHYFSYIWLHMSMLGVLMLRDGIPFLVAWELMAVSSFMLILFEAEKRSILKTAVNYLIQMHVGLVLLVIGFLLLESDTGIMSFDSLKMYFAHMPNTGLFLLFFAGFSIKAGFIPFHTWLPEAHPAAPSHVSGLMSGIMIEMGIYGIVRVISCTQSDQVAIGLILISISAVSAILGILMAIGQDDLKKLLAYSSIENIGIMGIGLGIGMTGLGTGNHMIALLGFCGGLLHVLNHSLFKSLLFFSTGSVYQACHTRNLENLGGVIRKMPGTTGLFLLGSLAICGLPPLNGFISEILIYIGLFKGLSSGTVYQSVIMMMVIITMVLTGGLALYCFTKASGIGFLGTARSGTHIPSSEAGIGMLIPQMIIVVIMLAIGLFPLLFVQPLARIVAVCFNLHTGMSWFAITESLSQIGKMGLALITLTLILLYLRYRILKDRVIATGPTWGCGYTAVDARQQYTGSSYAEPISGLAEPILKPAIEEDTISEEEIFPKKKAFRKYPVDIFRTTLNRLIDFLMLVLKNLARLQTGNIQHYILYAFIFMLLIFTLLYLKII